MADRYNPVPEDGKEDIGLIVSKISILEDQYKNDILQSPDMIYKKQCFNGLIKYIAVNIKHLVNLDDLVQLDNIWNLYANLCYKYNHTVTIERYHILIGINKDTWYQWLHGNTRVQYSEILGSSRSDLVKKWDLESESSWQDEASTGNPGPMFVLKARRGWTETPQQIQVIDSKSKTVDQIAQQYGDKLALDNKKADGPAIDF